MAADGQGGAAPSTRFFARFQRMGTGAYVAAAILGLLVLVPTAVLAWTVSTGALLPEAPSTSVAPRGHVVRTHGWGGYYIGMGGGRGHFGGGGRIH